MAKIDKIRLGKKQFYHFTGVTKMKYFRVKINVKM